jgi:Domain of unknown function (DUF6458)
MRTAPGLALIAVGAIFAFAITGSPSWINLQVAGWVLILTGVAAILIPRRGYGWLRRRVVVRRPRGSAAEAGGQRRALGTGRGFRRPSGPVRTEEELSTPKASRERTIPGAAEPTEETVEEYFEE